MDLLHNMHRACGPVVGHQPDGTAQHSPEAPQANLLFCFWDGMGCCEQLERWRGWASPAPSGGRKAAKIKNLSDPTSRGQFTGTRPRSRSLLVYGGDSGLSTRTSACLAGVQEEWMSGGSR